MTVFDVQTDSGRKALANVTRKVFQFEVSDTLNPYEFTISDNGFLLYVGVEVAELILEYAKKSGKTPRFVRAADMN